MTIVVPFSLMGIVLYSVGSFPFVLKSGGLALHHLPFTRKRSKWNLTQHTRTQVAALPLSFPVLNPLLTVADTPQLNITKNDVPFPLMMTIIQKIQNIALAHSCLGYICRCDDTRVDYSGWQKHEMSTLNGRQWGAEI